MAAVVSILVITGLMAGIMTYVSCYICFYSLTQTEKESMKLFAITGALLIVALGASAVDLALAGQWLDATAVSIGVFTGFRHFNHRYNWRISHRPIAPEDHPNWGR